MTKTVTRLYPQFKPNTYDVLLHLHPDKMTFEGSVVISGKKTSRPSQRLTLHQKDLVIHGATIRRIDKRGDQIFTVDRINTHKSFDEVRLHTKEKLLPGNYVVMLQFKGRITDNMNGLYPCYFTHEGTQKKLLATQFESHHAREVFPCIDEPEAKATFNLVLDTPDEGTVLSNTPMQSESSDGNGRRRTFFETTPVMSTYLLAFAYGEIGYKEAVTASGTKVRTYATPQNVALTDFALRTAVQCLEFYEDYFGIPYPLAKCDMIALPDFASGAMENWGLITYREQTMLVDGANTSLVSKQYVAMVVAHELAHQWFGNLVTMSWWTDLWLNEGFASWIEYLAIDTLFPEWQMWTQFIVNEQQSALKLDALYNTHAIEVPIHHPDEIRSIFDAISYNKGASVIHMLHGYLGANDFRDGLRYYLQKHAYGNTETVDLWAALEHMSGKPVKTFMHAWTAQPGFPVVSVSQRNTELHLSQERFYMQKPTKKDHNLWPVPILGPSGAPTSLPEASTVSHTHLKGKINLGQSGFYRTMYDSELIDEISGLYSSLTPLDRLGLLADSFETAKAGYSSITQAFSLLQKATHEDNAAVWDIIASCLGETRRIMDDDTVREAIKPFIRSLISTQLKRLGWHEHKTDSYFDKLLRPTILGMASSSDEQSVLDEAQNRFKDASSAESIPADLRGIIYTTAARHGDKKTFAKLLKFHNQTDSSEERTTLAAALTSFEQPLLIQEALDLIPTDVVRHQDVMYWVAYSFMNRHAKHATWDWMKSHWHWLEKNLGSDLSFYRTPIYAARSFSDEKFLSEYNHFFTPKISPSLERSIKQGHELLEGQVAWKTRDLAAVTKFLTDL